MATKKKKKEQHKSDKQVQDDHGISMSELLASARDHWDEARAELSVRITHKEQGFDEYDSLYRSHLNRDKWPFNSRIFVPLTFTSVFGKGTRLITGKIKGRLIPTQHGNELAASIGTELLSSQYDENDAHFEESMISKWLRMDQNARKYGAAFALVPWRKETNRDGKTMFDGPTMEVLDNRKVYVQPGAVSVTDADYVIVERDVTIAELERVNDRAGETPAYINLDKLKEAAATDRKQENDSVNTDLRSLTNLSEGRGKHKRFRMLTEYRRDTWVSWFPDVGGDKDEPPGLITRVIDNPYKHGQIPIIRLVYIPIDDDIYGVSELEPVRSEQKATNALVSGFIEAVSTELYPIIKGHPTNVDWKTIEFKPRAAWIMNSPQTDVIPMEGSITFTRNFVEAYKLLISQFSNAMGDTTAEASQLAGLETDKTATEIRDLAMKRGSRDNLNKIFLAASVTKMYTLWHEMNQQFLTDKKVIRVAGKQALQYFTEEGLDRWTLSQEGYESVARFMEENPTITDPESGVTMQMDYELAYEILRESGELDQFAEPMFPALEQGKKLPKLNLEQNGKVGFLNVEHKDLTGQYRFEVDLNTVGTPTESEDAQNMIQLLESLKELSPAIEQNEGYRVKFKEMIEDIAEKTQVKNADQYFEQISEQEQAQQQMQQQGGQAMGDPNELPQPTNVPGMGGGQPQQGGGVTPESMIGGLRNGG